jgi:hypothetical protein
MLIASVSRVARFHAVLEVFKPSGGSLGVSDFVERSLEHHRLDDLVGFCEDIMIDFHHCGFCSFFSARQPRLVQPGGGSLDVPIELVQFVEFEKFVDHEISTDLLKELLEIEQLGRAAIGREHFLAQFVIEEFHGSNLVVSI